MREQEKAALIVLLVILLKAFLVQAQEPEAPPRIANSGADTVFYCSASVAVAPQIAIENINFDQPSEGIKISIANYKNQEDTLVYSGTRFNAEWFENYGYLALTGAGTSEEYEQAVKQVYYENQAEQPSLDLRSFSISLLDADYLPHTGHFYLYIKERGIPWTEARDSAANMNYYGLQGYLATITSSVENDFIWSKIDGVGWIGATDSETENTWKWVTGPEAGTIFWQGRANGYRVNGRYSNWNNGEPNNVQKDWGDDEDYAHINADPGSIPKSWNDLPNEGDKNNPDGYYFPEGFIVEFGGMDGDPEIQLSASVYVKVSKIAFAKNREYEICRGESVELNLEASDRYSYQWLPDENLSSASVSNPLANPDESKTYRAIGTLGTCVDTANFIVNVNPLPQHQWEDQYTICKGDSVELNPGNHHSYLWSTTDTSQTITVQEEGWHSVKLTNEFGCVSTDTTRVNWSTHPEVDYGDLDTLVCGNMQQKLNLSFEENQPATLLSAVFPDSEVLDASTLSPTLSVNKFGNYRFLLEMTDEHGCYFTDTLDVEFHNQPTADFFIDSAKCKGYNLDVNYTGNTVEPADFYWYSNDTVFVSGINLDSVQVPLGYGIRERSIGLRIDEQGCVAERSEPVFVTPVLDFWAENGEGCTPLDVQFDYNASEPIDSFSWDFDDGTTSSLENPEHTFENPGTTGKNFNVSLTVVSADGCENTGVINNPVTVHPIPSIDFNFNENNCYNENGTVSYSGSASERDTFLWDLSDFQTNEIIQHPGTSPGPLQFELSSRPQVEIGLQVVSEFGCQTSSISKLFKRKPLFDIPVDTLAGCPPLEVSLEISTTDTADNVVYTWNLGAGKTATGNSISETYTEPNKNHDVEIIARSSVTGCIDTLLLPSKIVIHPVPEAAFTATPDVVLVSNPVVDFTNQSEGANDYRWNFDDLSPVSEEVNPTHSFSEMGFYDVMLTTFNELRCTDTTTVRVSVAFDRLFPPNAFSPNAPDEEDREFRIYSEGVVNEGYQLLIFNRWGEVVFESSSQQNGWDGKMKNGNFAPAGTYTWTITYFDFTGKRHKQQGTVTLLF
jgi:gliding motility-associated-like protein